VQNRPGNGCYIGPAESALDPSESLSTPAQEYEVSVAPASGIHNLHPRLRLLPRAMRPAPADIRPPIIIISTTQLCLQRNNPEPITNQSRGSCYHFAPCPTSSDVQPYAPARAKNTRLWIRFIERRITSRAYEAIQKREGERFQNHFHAMIQEPSRPDAISVRNVCHTPLAASPPLLSAPAPPPPAWIGPRHDIIAMTGGDCDQKNMAAMWPLAHACCCCLSRSCSICCLWSISCVQHDTACHSSAAVVPHSPAFSPLIVCSMAF
jgi:hypothetical protein